MYNLFDKTCYKTCFCLTIEAQIGLNIIFNVLIGIPYIIYIYSITEK